MSDTPDVMPDVDPQVVVEALRLLDGQEHDAMEVHEAWLNALPHAERIATLWPLYEELEAHLRSSHTSDVGRLIRGGCEVCSILSRIEEAKAAPKEPSTVEVLAKGVPLAPPKEPEPS